MMIQVRPLDDDRPHTEDTTCACQPRVIEENGNLMVVHQAFDGREGLEEAQALLRVSQKGKGWEVFIVK